MTISRVNGLVPAVNYNKNNAVSVQKAAPDHVPSPYTKANRSQYHSAVVEKISHTDLSLYDEVQHYPNNQHVKMLMSLNIKV